MTGGAARPETGSANGGTCGTPTTVPPLPHHVGRVVDDLDAAMAHLTALTGCGWAPPRERTLRVRTPEGPREAQLRFTYSVQGPPFTELVEDLRGDIWAPQAYGLDHIGYLVEDVERAVAEAEAHGSRLLVHDDGPGGRANVFAYLEQPGRVRVEFVAADFADRLAEWALEIGDTTRAEQACVDRPPRRR